ncbi:MAG: inositol monophosphatase family protein, partial [Microbacterium sp.]
MGSETDLLSLAVDIAREAGELAQRRRSEGVAIAATKSALADIVTEADREVESRIRARIAEARPDDGFLGEESGAQRGTSEVTWVVDPIDGTVNYAYGLPFYAVSIAAVAGEPHPAAWTALAGAVFAPALGELFTASRGGGAFLGQRRLRVLVPAGEAGALLA